MIFAWIGVFILSLVVILKGTDWFLESADKIARHFGLSPFVTGVLIVGIGTSLPKLLLSFIAIYEQVPGFVVAEAVGSNFTNILFILSIAVIAAGGLKVTKNLIDSEIPMLVVSTILFVVTVFDGVITVVESFILVLAYLVYLYYTFQGEGDETAKKIEILPDFQEKLKPMDNVWFVAGIVLMGVSAFALVLSVEHLSALWGIPAAIISITALALGTSLPELIISVKAALQGKHGVAIGNIFGSNAFNTMIVVGLPSVIMLEPLEALPKTLMIGVPAMALATLAFVFSSISRRIYTWEAAMYILFYILIIIKIVDVV